jgi:NADP-dependent 3-hydroxy acid dehydrogenase YdfG
LGVLPSMRERHQGRIVNITSIGGKVAFPHLLPYTASKFALVGFSRKTDRPGVSERGERSCHWPARQAGGPCKRCCARTDQRFACRRQ